VEVTARRFEILDPLPKDNIRAAHHTEASGFKAAPKKIGTGKEGEDKLHSDSVTRRRDLSRRDLPG
jgi:hypothetical protein